MPITRIRSNRAVVCIQQPTYNTAQLRQNVHARAHTLALHYYFPIGCVLKNGKRRIIVYNFWFGVHIFTSITVNRDRLHFEVFTSWQRKSKKSVRDPNIWSILKLNTRYMSVCSPNGSYEPFFYFKFPFHISISFDLRIVSIAAMRYCTSKYYAFIIHTIWEYVWVCLR